MNIEPAAVWADLKAIRNLSPLIHNVTNYVVMEQTANALLALGASPVMTQAVEEVEDMTKISQALVLNMGTITPMWEQNARVACLTAKQKGMPIVFDPVGVGATAYRTSTGLALIKEESLSAIRGNASEILALCERPISTKGVDSTSDSMRCIDEARALSSKIKSVIIVSGEVDVVTNGESCVLVKHGHPMMRNVTGMGCTATAVIGAFSAVNKNSLFACTHAMIAMGVCGEIAAQQTRGPGSFKMAFMDALYEISLVDLEGRLTCDYIS